MIENLTKKMVFFPETHSVDGVLGSPKDLSAHKVVKDFMPTNAEARSVTEIHYDVPTEGLGLDESNIVVTSSDQPLFVRRKSSAGADATYEEPTKLKQISGSQGESSTDDVCKRNSNFVDYSNMAFEELQTLISGKTYDGNNLNLMSSEEKEHVYEFDEIKTMNYQQLLTNFENAEKGRSRKKGNCMAYFNLADIYICIRIAEEGDITTDIPKGADDPNKKILKHIKLNVLLESLTGAVSAGLQDFEGQPIIAVAQGVSKADQSNQFLAFGNATSETLFAVPLSNKYTVPGEGHYSVVSSAEGNRK